MDLLYKRARVLAMHFQGVVPTNIPEGLDFDGLMKIWKDYLISEELTAEQADRVIDVDSTSFEKELRKGEFLEVVKAQIDPLLLRLGLTTQEEIDSFRLSSSTPRRAAATSGPRVPKAEKTEPGKFDGLKPGTKITIEGKSWVGFIAEIVSEEAQHYVVKTTLKRGGEWSGRIRKAGILAVLN